MTKVVGVRLNDYQIEMLTKIAGSKSKIPDFVRELLDQEIRDYVKARYQRSSENKTV